MKLLVLISLCCFITSCATVEKYEAKLETFVGKDEDNLINQWGVPNNTYTLKDGSKLLMYQTNGGSASVPVGNINYLEHYWCKTTFTIANGGIVKSWKHEGNKCQAD